MDDETYGREGHGMGFDGSMGTINSTAECEGVSEGKREEAGSSVVVRVMVKGSSC